MGFAGRIARVFLHSRLTPLTAVSAVLLGLLALATLPREEEPQIRVPMIDIELAWPGAPVEQVERQLTTPVERQLSRIPDLEYLYSTSRSDGALVIARFRVGSDPERALTRVRARLEEARVDQPPGASIASVALRSIDDVPVLGLTLWSPTRPDLDPGELRRIGDELAAELRKAPGVAHARVLGGWPREVTIAPDPGRMNAARIGVDALSRALTVGGLSLPAGATERAGSRVEIRAESPYADVESVRSLPLATRDGRTVRLSEVADVTDGPADPEHYVFLGDRRGSHPAVTIEVEKLPGVNAARLVQFLHRRVAELKPVLLADVAVETTRDYGRTAQHKSDDLMFHLLLATLSVVGLIVLALGRREAVVVAVAIPVTLALTLFLDRLLGYTLNRVTLFALIFSIGILVDDAIVVVENIARHFAMRDGRDVDRRVVEAVDEVGNPTVLATVTVIAAILPLAFVGGLMGPYMKPIPIGASLAMLFSLAVAFMISPWASRLLLARSDVARGRASHGAVTEGGLDRLYRHVMGGLLDRPRWRLAFFVGIAILLGAAVALIATRVVTVKMLPFDNKSEFEVLVDLPPGTPLESTLAAAGELADVVARDPDVERYALYAGVGAPITFNGLVRHYDLRNEPRFATLQVMLAEGHRPQSHVIAKRVRPLIERAAARFGARVKVVEVPPGPPVLSTLVAEVYGPDLEGQRRLAHQVLGVFDSMPGVVDTDLMLTEGAPRTRLAVDRERAALGGVVPADVTSAIATLLGGARVGTMQFSEEPEPVPVRVRLDPARRADLAALGSLRMGPNGTPISEMTRAVTDSAPPEVHHKDLHRVVYVLGDVAGREESPVYAIGGLRPRIADLRAPDGGSIHQLSTRPPDTDERYALKWDGEWHITYEVFRDMGAAFAVVLVLIYILTVGWFRSFVTPLVIMVPIPLSLIGILPAHALLGAFFTATSMIGFIAGAGITVRNSIILVDFIELRRAQGLSLRDAVIDAGAVRFRPMVLTAAAVTVGAGVILFDPIFQGLAVALIGGEIAATVLSRVAVPVLYYLAHQRSSRSGDRARDARIAPATRPPERLELAQTV
jgi:multidrug efflux pump subunit AcrB